MNMFYKVFSLIYFPYLFNCLRKDSGFLSLKKITPVEEIKEIWNSKAKCDDRINIKIDELLFSEDENMKDIYRQIAISFFDSGLNLDVKPNEKPQKNPLSYEPPIENNHSSIKLHEVTNQNVTDSILKVQTQVNQSKIVSKHQDEGEEDPIQQQIMNDAEELTNSGINSPFSAFSEKSLMKYYNDQYKYSKPIPKDILNDFDFQLAREKSERRKERQMKNSVKWTNDFPKFSDDHSNLNKNSDEENSGETISLNDENLKSSLVEAEKENDDSYSIANNENENDSNHQSFAQKSLENSQPSHHFSTNIEDDIMKSEEKLKKYENMVQT